MRIVFARGRADTRPALAEPLAVNNCGYYRDLSEDVRVFRKDGRADYQILFVRRGELLADGRRCRDGGVYVYAPGERQSYVYKAVPGCCYYWAHFSGSEADAFARKFALAGFFDKRRDAARLEDLFLAMADAFTAGLKECGLFAVGALLSAAAVIASPPQDASPFRRAQDAIADLSQPLCVKTLAASFHLSCEHFIRAFKAYCGLTPLAYRRKCRTEYAKTLLSGTALGIADVAEACGFSDPLYFSRAFKKQTGLSPRAYRARL